MSLPGSVDDLEDANEQESPSSTEEDQTDAVLTLEKVAKYHRGKWDMVLLQVHAYNTALMAEAAAAVEQLTPEMAAAGTELLAGMQEPLLTLSLALCAAKRGNGGRTSEPDPATDKRIDPMTAKRIMDKRRTAALSKFKQKVASLAEVAVGAGLMTGGPLNPDGALARQPGSGAADPALAAVAAAATASAAAAAAGGGTAWGIRNGLALSQPSSPTVAERAAAAAAFWGGERNSRAPVRRARSFYAGSTSRGPAAAAAAADAGRNLRMRASLTAEAADWAVGSQFKKRSQGQLQQAQEGKQQAGPARAQRSVKRQKSQQVLGSSPIREVSNREGPARPARSASPLLEVPHNGEAALDEDQQAWQQQAWQQQAFQLQGLDGFSGEGGQPYGMPANGLEPGCAGAATAGPGDMGFQDVYTRAADKHTEGEPTSAAAGAAAAACNAAGAEDSMLLNMQQADGDADGNWLLQEFGVPGSPTLADLLMFDSPTESPKAGNSNPTPADWALSNPQGQQLQQEGSGLAARSSAMMPAHTACAGGASAATGAPGAGLSGHVAAQHTSRSQSAGTACAGADAGIAAAGYLEQQAAVLTDVQSGMQGMHIMGSAAGAVPEPEQRMGGMPAQQDQGTACWPQQRMGAQQVRDALYVLQQDSALPARQVQGANCIVQQSAACRPQHFMGGIPAPQEHGATDVLQHEPAMHAQESTAYVRDRPALQLPAGDPMTAGGMVSPATSSASAHAPRGASSHAPRALQLASLLAGGAWQQQDSRIRNNNSPAQLLAGSGSRASPNTDNSSGHSSAAVLPVDVAASMAAIQAHGQLLPDQLAQRLLQGTQQQGMQRPRWSGVTADTLMGAMPMLGQGAGMQQAGASTSTEMAGKFGTAGLAEQQARNRNAGGSAHPHADMHAGLQGYQGTGLAQHGSTAFGADAAGIAGRGFGALGFTTTTPAAGSTANGSGSISGAGGRGADGLSDMMRGAMASCGLQPAVLNSRRPVQHHASTGDLTQVSHVNKLQQQLMQQQQDLQAAAAALQEQLSATAGRARPALSEGMLGQGLSCRITRGGSMPGDMPAGNLLGMGAPG